MRFVRVAPAALSLLLLVGCPTATPTESTVCANVTCGGNGHCAESNGKAECVCNAGFKADGLACVAADLCANDPCAATGKSCTVSNGQAVCACPAGTLDQGNGCVAVSACAVNPCTTANQTVCFDHGDGGTSCLCDPGFEPNGGACTSITDGGGPSCGGQHSGGSNDDAFEPDECPSLSPLYDLSAAAAVSHTLSAADEDWIHFSVPALHIVSIDFSGSTIPLYVDVFGSDGVTPVAADHSGVNNPSFKLVADTGGLLYLRVKAAVANDTGSYSVTLTDSGADDFPNTASAATLSSTSSFTGKLDYSNDEDYSKLSVQPGHSYRFTLASSTASGIGIELYELDGTTLRRTLDTAIAANQTHLARPKASGAYLLHAKALTPGTTGNYSLQMTDLGADDYGDVVADADPITVSSTATSALFERSDDVDVFTFTVVPNHTYRFTCTQSGQGCIMSMRDPSGVVVAQQSSSNSSTTTISAVPLAPGVWNVSAHSYSSGGVTGAYSFQLEDLGGDDYSNSYQTPYLVTLGANTNGSLELATDHDVFAFDTTANHIYKASCASTTTNAHTCAMIIRNASGTQVGQSSGTNGNTQTVQVLSPSGGRFTVDVYSSPADQSGLYTLTVTDVGTDDYPNSTSSATSVTVGNTVSASVDYQSDVDAFSVSTTAGHIYQVKCTGSLQGCNVQAWDPQNTPIGPGYGIQPVIGFKSTSGGIYTFTVGSYYSWSYGAYSFTVTDVGTDDHGDTPLTATALTIGTGMGGNIQYATDADVFSFSGTTQHLYKVTCAPSGTTNYLQACAINVRDASATSVATTSGYSGTSVIFEAGSTQTYTVAITGTSQSYYGDYQVTVIDQGLDDYGDSPATATPVAPGSGPKNGQIEVSGDHDVIGFTSVPNHIYRLSCTTSSYSLCAITARDANGTTVSSDTAGTSASVLFYAATAQAYTIDLSASTYSGATGTYTFTLFDDGTDDYTNSTTGATTVSPGTITGNIQYPSDKDVFLFAATAGKVYNFTISTSTNYPMTIRDPNGALVKSGNVGSVGFAASTAGTYSFEIAQGSAALSSYSITFRETVDDAPDTSTGASTLTLGTSVNKAIDYTGDVDFFAGNLTGGTTYTITATSGAMTMFITMYQTDGVTPIGSWSTNSKTFAPTATGTYFIRIEQLQSYTGAYTLRVQ